MQKLLVFTDIHIVPDGADIIGLDPFERFTQGLAHAVATHPDAARIIITGDLAHHGDPVEYARLKAELDGCPLPVHLMIGNHDRRADFLTAFPDTPVTDQGFVQAALDLDDYRLILLDTVEQEAAIEHSGYLCAERLGWLERELQAAQNRPVIVFAHHPPIATGFAGMDHIGLSNRAELASLLAKYKNVRQIIAGHVHRTISGSTAGIPTAIFKSTCHQMPMELELETTYASIDEPGAYGLLLLSAEGVIVHTEDFTLPHQEPSTYETPAEDAA